MRHQCARHTPARAQGTRQITDVTVRGLRGGGWVNRALYNVVGPGAWTVVDCTAMFPAGGGLVAPRSLLPKTAHPAAGADKAHPPPRKEAAAAPATAAQQQAEGGAQRRTWWGWVRGQRAPQSASAGGPFHEGAHTTKT